MISYKLKKKCCLCVLVQKFQCDNFLSTPWAALCLWVDQLCANTQISWPGIGRECHDSSFVLIALTADEEVPALAASWHKTPWLCDSFDVQERDSRMTTVQGCNKISSDKLVSFSFILFPLIVGQVINYPSVYRVLMIFFEAGSFWKLYPNLQKMIHFFVRIIF